MREDDFTTTEADAARFAAIAGASEHIGSPVGDQEPNPTLARALGPDPWEPFVCPACSERTDQMPETCPACRWRNYGFPTETS
jgi:hypothetical protein